MLKYDGAPLIVSIFVEDNGITPGDVDRADSIIPEIIGVKGRPFAGNGKRSSTIAVVLEYSDGWGWEVFTVSTTMGPTNMSYMIRRKGVVGVFDVGVFRNTLMMIVSNWDEPNG